MCSSDLDPAMVERMKQRPSGSPHSWDDERARRVASAASHPDAADLERAAENFKTAWDKLKVKSVQPEKAERWAILQVAFGTTHKRAASAYDRIEHAVNAAHPGIPVFRAYTSGMVRRKMTDDGQSAKSVSGMLNQLVLDGYTSVEVISLHIVAGEEYHQMVNGINAFRNAATGFRRLEVGRPLLADAAAMRRVASALQAIIPSERQPEDGVIFMGHGNRRGHGDFSYLALSDELNRQDRNIFLATVEGCCNFAPVPATLRERRIGKVYLMPFMTVAGDHAENDLAGKAPDSWQSQIKALGIQTVPVLRGLGEYDNFAALFAGGGQMA